MANNLSSYWKFTLILGLVGLFHLFGVGNVSAEVPSVSAKESAHPASIHLWPNGAPGYESRKDEPEKLDWREEPENNITFPVLFNIHNPSVTPFLPDKSNASGAAVIIAPGGGHMFVTIDREGYDLGKWLADHGVAAFVLKYRLARDKAGNSPYKADVEAFADAKRSVRLIRSRAAEWGIDPNRVGFMGFSAGGQLAGMMGTKFDHCDPDANDPIDRISCRPNFLGLIYGGASQNATYSQENTPPAFLLAAYNDSSNAKNLANTFLALQAAKVPAELHLYGIGGHGFGARTDRSIAVETWPARFHDWLKDIGMLTSKK